MRAFRYRRHVVVATLAATATAVLLGCQQLTSAPAPVISVVVDNTLSFQKLEVQKEIFHTHVVQVAHKSLPCGTVIRIEDTDTGKSIDAEVTDRGPYVAGRIVDLSYAAFTQLDPIGTGLLNVNVYIVDTSNQYLYKLR